MKPVAKSISLQQWKWPLTKWYNGFSPAERVRGWQVSRWLIAVGGRPAPAECSICGHTEGIKYHSENYYEPWLSPPVCKSCHYAIHQRFCHLRPHLFQRMLDRYAPPIGHWVLNCSLNDDNDFAGELRLKHGEDIIHLERHIPDVKDHPFPAEQLHPLESGPEKTKSWNDFKKLTASRKRKYQLTTQQSILAGNQYTR